MYECYVPMAVCEDFMGYYVNTAGSAVPMFVPISDSLRNTCFHVFLDNQLIMILSVIGFFLYVLFMTSKSIVPQSTTMGKSTSQVTRVVSIKSLARFNRASTLQVSKSSMVTPLKCMVSLLNYRGFGRPYAYVQVSRHSKKKNIVIPSKMALLCK